MLYRATHITRYKYDQPVATSLNEARLTPRSLPWQRVLASALVFEPEPVVREHRLDYFGNQVMAFSVFQSHDLFTATATSIVEVQPRLIDNLPAVAWEDVRLHLSSHLDDESLRAYEFIFDSPFVPLSPELAAYAKPSFPAGRPLADAVKELSHRIYTEFLYKPKSTSIETPLAQVLRARRGVCQDFAHVLIGAIRSLHLAARYVSGYLRSGEDVTGSEASHAWVSAFIPGYGWLDLDPTNDVIPSEGHITLAWGRDYGDVPPFKGISLGGGGHRIEVDVKVQPIAS